MVWLSGRFISIHVVVFFFCQFSNRSQEENGTEKTRILESGPQNGVWRLTVKGSDTRTFDVQADAETTIQVSAKLFTQYTGMTLWMSLFYAIF